MSSTDVASPAAVVTLEPMNSRYGFERKSDLPVPRSIAQKECALLGSLTSTKISYIESGYLEKSSCGRWTSCKIRLAECVHEPVHQLSV